MNIRNSNRSILALALAAALSACGGGGGSGGNVKETPPPAPPPPPPAPQLCSTAIWTSTLAIAKATALSKLA